MSELNVNAVAVITALRTATTCGEAIGIGNVIRNAEFGDVESEMAVLVAWRHAAAKYTISDDRIIDAIDARVAKFSQKVEA